MTENSIDNLIELSIYYRGYIMHNALVIEQQIENYLILYFVPDDLDKQVTFVELFLSRTSFESKIQIFEKILVAQNSLDEKFLSDLKYVKNIRNKFAHQILYTGYNKKEKIKSDFNLISIRDKIEVRRFSKGDFEQFKIRSDKCLSFLKTL